jgi:hypothetical protein
MLHAQMLMLACTAWLSAGTPTQRVDPEAARAQMVASACQRVHADADAGEACTQRWLSFAAANLPIAPICLRNGVRPGRMPACVDAMVRFLGTEQQHGERGIAMALPDVLAHCGGYPLCTDDPAAACD